MNFHCFFEPKNSPLSHGNKSFTDCSADSQGNELSCASIWTFLCNDLLNPRKNAPGRIWNFTHMDRYDSWCLEFLLERKLLWFVVGPESSTPTHTSQFAVPSSINSWILWHQHSLTRPFIVKFLNRVLLYASAIYLLMSDAFITANFPFRVFAILILLKALHHMPTWTPREQNVCSLIVKRTL